MVSIVVYHGEPRKNIHFEIWRRLTPSTRGPKFLRKIPFLDPFITLVEEFTFIVGNMTWHYKPPDRIQSHPRQSPDPSRHLPDTPETPKIWALFVHTIPVGVKQAANKNESNGMYINCLHIIPSNHNPESLRQPPDTYQTPSGHPTNILRHMGLPWWERRNLLTDQKSCILICQPPGTFRHPTDILKTPQNRALFIGISSTVLAR